MKSYAVWVSHPLFVTSTFRDMRAERDWLHTHVFPALAERHNSPRSAMVT
jgi:hypothetical protein